MNKTTRKVGAALGLAAIAGYCAALPAAASSTTAEWGIWGTDDPDHDYTVSFTDPAMPDAVVDIYNSDVYDIYTTELGDADEYFPADTPIGSVFGANGPDEVNNFLKVYTYDNLDDWATVTIEFASPVPAGQIGLAISDIDSDNAKVTMYDDNDVAISGENVIGTATDSAFNFCVPAVYPSSCDADSNSNSNVPTITAESNYVAVDSDTFRTNGTSAWFMPSAEVASIKIEILNEDPDYPSTERIWLAQIVSPVDSSAELGQTGIEKSTYLVAIAGGAILAAGGFIGLRRRRDI